MRPSRPYQRVDRVAHEIQQILGATASCHINLSHLGLVTFTRVTVSPDLRKAKVFYSVLEPKKSPEDLQIALERLSKAFRKYLGQALTIKFTPELSFFYDDTLEYTQRIDTLIKNLDRESKQ